ncbi:hypothetical protein K438DRAFT_1917558 [Mycena galopus ATCC 62051]|nr:hypothetical protein K438DRAFT_1917558 [Mycena galopus ATCC 62051]
MPKEPKPRARATGKRSAGKKKSTTSSADILKQNNAAMQDEFGKAPNTKGAYKGYLARGRAIIADVVAERRQLEEDDPGFHPESIDVELLAVALEGPPNKHSVYALSLYLTQKCVEEGLGKSTADGIHGAFANYWDHLPDSGGKYAGQYLFDEETGKVSGNPARAVEIQSFMKCIKNKARVKGAAATRQHAEATTVEDMRAMMQFSLSKCPNKKVEDVPQTADDLLLVIRHGQTRAFLSTGYTLWTRNFETCQIQMRDITEGTGPSPYNLPILSIFLDNRKGWQLKQGYDGPLESLTYEIYEQKDAPEIDMFSHVHRWLKLYRRLLGRDFEGDDYLFPLVSTNGLIHAKKPMTHDTAQDRINEFAAAALIKKFFTTHCLRRGGSQYRFMFAPLGKRWSLTIIRWWGGWAEGEHVDTLMRYLLDSLQSYESGHGDALNPFRTEPDKSFMGEHSLLEPPTKAEFRLFGEQLFTKIDSVTRTPNVTPEHLSALLTSFANISTSISTVQSTTSDVATGGTGVRLLADRMAAGSQDGEVMDTLSNSSPSSPAGATPDPTASDVIPIANAIIPNVGRSSTAWKRAIDQWYTADPANGLTKALKDWPTEWHTGKMRTKVGALYSNRKLLAEEYERMGSSDDAFKMAYPEYPKITPLLAAIRARNGLVRPRR